MLHLVEDGLRGGGGVGGLGDRAADDEVAGSGGEGRGGRGDAFLVAGVGADGPDARNDKGRRGKALAEDGDLFRAGDQPRNAGLGGGVGEAEYLVFRGVIDADGGELELVHGGEDSDSKEQWRIGETGGGFGGGFEHGGTAGGVDGEELGSCGGGGADSAGDGVGDVVELKVEEDGEAAAAELLDDGGAFGAVELEADLAPADEAVEAAGKVERGSGGWEVEGDDEAIHL